MFGHSAHIHNQTDSKSISAIASAQSMTTELGVGLFLLPDPEKGALEFKKIIVEGITYKECIQRGHYCLAFKWVPGKLDRKALLCHSGCENGLCTDTFCICNPFNGHLCT